MRAFIEATIREAGELAHGYFREGVSHTTKAHAGDLLTQADIAVSDFLISEIGRNYSTHTIKSEELKDKINPGGTHEWVIDPIDGTRNFAMGIPFWCILVAVLEGDEPILAAMYNPVADDLFVAEKDGGAYLNGRRISVNGVDSLDHAFGVSIRGVTENKTKANFDRLMKRLVDGNSWMHNYGTMLISGYVADGGVDFLAVNCGKDHDYLAPALICREAGALVTDIHGNPWTRACEELVIANPRLHSQIIELLS
jgi:myo-inositol-1(or 4)-monophosphatase